MRILNRCPHCRTRATARSSREMSLTFREITFQCANPECGHTYVVNMEFARTLSPSAVPNLALHLPLSPHVRERLAAQLELPV
ncbi:ogr/Delta-like zinc finger family protein [Burkholderia sp. AU31624]|uniref:ogr/Delta-like zinc finger family protein n=1 Tax=Burkholderia sp. AU31624 TaxID=2879629 RepID=UPI001CF36191|nr:ogr/Delta-like zinc finger family protein [Burkholderia sp. AU31624]MCA8258694.1 ogr/Delta-like zinc finger family protein [Burkholderia sp. AU31624]